MHIRLRALALSTLLCLMLAALVGCTLTPSLPDWVAWHTRDATCNGYPVRLEQRRVTVWQDASEQEVLCTSPDEWRVQDLAVADLDEDGSEELLMLSWRIGNFGTSRPFWCEDEKDEDWTQHLFRVQPETGTMRPLWMTSDIGIEVQEIRSAGRRVELVHRDGSTSCWEWETWGLTLIEGGSLADDASEQPAAGVQAQSKTQQAQPSPTDPETLGVVAAGDVICHSSMYAQSLSDNRDTPRFDFLFEHVAPHISAYDLAIVNQETILVDNPAEVSFYPLFGTPDSMGDALVSAGFDVVCAATNHAADKGARGVEHTLEFWRTRHPETTLLGLHGSNSEPSVSYRSAKGYTLALLDATEHLNGQGIDDAGASTCSIDTFDDLDRLLAQVREAEATADLTICMLHTGDEYAFQPSELQRTTVEKFIDAGADAVICTHTHVLQPFQKVRTGAGNQAVVYWGLGNFVSNQMNPRTVLGGMARLSVARDEGGNAFIRDFGLTPTLCHFEPSTTSVYLFDEYPNELAARHTLVQGFAR